MYTSTYKEKLNYINSSSLNETLSKLQNLLSNIIKKQNENSLLKKQLLSCKGFYPEIFFLKLDYFSKKNITTLDFLHYLEQHKYKFNDEIIRRFIKQYDKHGNFNLIFDDFINMILPFENNFEKNKNSKKEGRGSDPMDDMDAIFCEILINELKLIGLIGDLIIDIRKMNDFDTYRIFEIISNKEQYLNGEMIFNFLQGKFNTMEINRLVYYLDSNNDGLITYDDFHDLLLPIKGDFENGEYNNKFIFNEYYEDDINYSLNNESYNNYKNEYISKTSYLDNDFNLSNDRKTYFINYKINSRNKIPNIKRNNIKPDNKNLFKSEKDFISYKYLNCSAPIHEQNENFESQINDDESYKNEENNSKNNQIKNDDIINEDDINNIKRNNNTDTSRDKNMNLNEKQDQNQEEEINDKNKEEKSEVKIKEKEINNENNEYSKDEQNKENINNENNNSENDININENNIQNNSNNDIKNTERNEKKEDINNDVSLQKFPNTFGKNQDNDSSSKNDTKRDNSQNTNENKNINNINQKNSEKKLLKNILSNKNNHKAKKNLNKKNMINNKNIPNIQNQTFHIKSKLNLESNDNQYNDIIPINTYDFPLMEDRNIDINIKSNFNFNDFTNDIDAMSIFFEYINSIIYYENRAEHIKESLALREDLSMKEIFYLFDKDKTKCITINNFQLICKTVFKIFPTIDQIKLVFKRYKHDLNIASNNINNNPDTALTRNEFMLMLYPKKSQYLSLISKKNKIDKTKSKLSKKSKNILIELIKCLIIKESKYYKIRCQLEQNSVEYIWKEIYKYSTYGESINKFQFNQFLEEYGYFFGQKQLDIIFSIFDKDKKDLIKDIDFFEEMCYE